MKRPFRNRAGTALVAALVMAVALSAVAHGMLTVARLEYRVARIGSQQLQATATAQVGTQALFHEPPSPAHYSLGPWQSGATKVDSLGEGKYTSELVRLSDEIWLAKSVATVSGVASPTAAKALWRLDPALRVAEAGALITASSVLLDSLATLSTLDFTEPTNAPQTGCAWGARTSLLRTKPLPSVAGIASTGFDLGLLTLDSVVTRVTDPAVVVHGPLSRARTPGSRGLLVVLGDLLLTASGHAGYLVVKGNLTLESGAWVTGLVSAEGVVSVLDSSQVHASACWAAEALARDELLRPAVLPGWIGPF